MALRSPLIALSLLLLLPATASGAEVHMDFAGRGVIPSDTDPSGFERVSVYEIVFTAANGEANRLEVTQLDRARTRIEDSGAPLQVREGGFCEADGAAAVCTLPPPSERGIAVVRADLGDGDDHTLTPIHGDVRGGAGNDFIAADTLVDGGPGADTMVGTGTGTLTYVDRDGGVSVTFDGQANDGEPGEGDNVAGTFQVIHGGSGNDVLEASGGPPGRAGIPTVHGLGGDDRLVGSANAEWLIGGAGDDVMEGGDGNDVLEGLHGADRGRGGAGIDTWDARESGVVSRPADATITPDDRPNDGARGEGDDVGSDIESFRTGSGDDHITGTNGANVIEPGPGDDTIRALGGDDRILSGIDPFGTPAEQGNKTIDAGRGADSIAIAVSRGDTLRLRDGESDTAQCEPDEPPAALDADPIDGLGGCVTPLRFSRRSLSLRLTHRGTAALIGRCPDWAASCIGRLNLHERGRPTRIATGRYTIEPGFKDRVRVELTKAGRRLFRTRSRIAFVATAVPDDLNARRETHARGVLLRAR